METVVINADPLAARTSAAPAPGSNSSSWLPCRPHSRRGTGLIWRSPLADLPNVEVEKLPVAPMFHPSPWRITVVVWAAFIPLAVPMYLTLSQLPSFGSCGSNQLVDTNTILHRCRYKFEGN